MDVPSRRFGGAEVDVRQEVEWTERGSAGPRVLLLPGLGARGSGFSELAERLAPVARPILVEYPEGAFAAEGAGALAARVAAAVGPVDGLVASSFAGLVAAHLAAAGHGRGVAFLGSFTHLDQLGWRGRAIALMGPIAVVGRPGALMAATAAARPVPFADVPRIVPTTRIERESVQVRAAAVAREPAPPALRDRPLRCVVVQGALDVLVPASTAHRLCAALPPGTACHRLGDAGHVPYYTHPDRVAELLRPWLAELEAAPLARAG